MIPPIQNALNYCPCCGTNLRAINLALNFSNKAAEPKPAPTPSPAPNGTGPAPEAGSRTKQIWALYQQGKKAVAIAREIGGSRSAIQSTINRCKKRERKNDGSSNGNGQKPHRSTPAERKAVALQIASLRKRGLRPAQIRKSGFSDSQINYWLYSKVGQNRMKEILAAHATK